VDFSRDYYEILGLDSKATSEDIKKAYRELAKKYHPDINRSSTSEELFKLISEAYEILSDGTKRTQYDLYRKFELDDVHAEAAPAADGGAYVPGGGMPDINVRQPPKAAEKVSTADRAQLLAMSLVVPGYYQMFAGEKRFGYMLFAIYFIFWALAFVQSLPIGLLAIFVWLYSFYDAFKHSGARS
jgi:curved DNA-binding protein CbpA